MRLLISGEYRDAIAIRAYRATHGLPPSFGVALFEPKDWTGLGRIDSAGAALKQVRDHVIAAVPRGLPLVKWLDFVPTLQQLFEDQLNAINAQVGLKDAEIAFAVAGFGDVCAAAVYAALRAHASGADAPSFGAVYADWLDESVRLSAAVHRYDHEGAAWAVQVITNAYGRVGLRVKRGDVYDYVHDGALACPAEGYMAALLSEVCGVILTSQ